MSYADDIINAIEDAERATKWAEPNRILYDDEFIGPTIRRTLTTYPPRNVPNGKPIFWLVTGEVDFPVHLLDGLANFHTAPTTSCCGRCQGARTSPYKLLVRAGASVLCFCVCGLCRDTLDDCFGGVVVWEERHG